MKLPFWVKAGTTFNLFYFSTSAANSKIHILAIIEDQVVMKEWLPMKSTWHYFIHNAEWFHVQITGDNIIKIKQQT